MFSDKNSVSVSEFSRACYIPRVAHPNRSLNYEVPVVTLNVHNVNKHRD
jgi:hypothetical protein